MTKSERISHRAVWLSIAAALILIYLFYGAGRVDYLMKGMSSFDGKANLSTIDLPEFTAVVNVREKGEQKIYDVDGLQIFATVKGSSTITMDLYSFDTEMRYKSARYMEPRHPGLDYVINKDSGIEGSFNSTGPMMKTGFHMGFQILKVPEEMDFLTVTFKDLQIVCYSR